MTVPELALACRLAQAIPDLARSMQVHLDTFDCLLPHVWFGDVARWAVDRSSKHGGDEEVGILLDLLEEAYDAKDGQVRELINASFVENLPITGDAHSRLLEQLGPQLRRQLDLQDRA